MKQEKLAGEGFFFLWHFFIFKLIFSITFIYFYFTSSALITFKLKPVCVLYFQSTTCRSGIIHRLSLSPRDCICLPAVGCRSVSVMFFFALHYTVSTSFKEVHNNSKNTCTTRQFWVSIKCKEITYNTYRIRGENQSFSWIPLHRANCLLCFTWMKAKIYLSI